MGLPWNLYPQFPWKSQEAGNGIWGGGGEGWGALPGPHMEKIPALPDLWFPKSSFPFPEMPGNVPFPGNFAPDGAGLVGGCQGIFQGIIYGIFPAGFWIISTPLPFPLFQRIPSRNAEMGKEGKIPDFWPDPPFPFPSLIPLLPRDQENREKRPGTIPRPDPFHPPSFPLFSKIWVGKNELSTP